MQARNRSNNTFFHMTLGSTFKWVLAAYEHHGPQTTGHHIGLKICLRTLWEFLRVKTVMPVPEVNNQC